MVIHCGSCMHTWGVWSGQVFVAIVFALEHRLGGSPWVQVIFGAFVGSLLFGMASIATRGLAVPIGVHAAWNFGTWLLGMKGQGGVWQQIVEPENEWNADVFGMAAYVVVLGTGDIFDLDLFPTHQQCSIGHDELI